MQIERPGRLRVRIPWLMLMSVLVGSAAVQAQATQAGAILTLTLAEALTLAEQRSEQMAIARAGITRAESSQLRARSERQPQLSASASYDRALASEFEGLFESAGGAFGDSASFEELPFGRPNTYRLNLSFSQNLYSGGRIRGQERQAQIARSLASLTLRATTAQLGLEVAQAFYDASLADRFVAIAEATYAQADRTFDQIHAQRKAGRVSEFELLRAQVARDTLQPQVIRQRAARDVSYMRLKQLLDLPLDATIQPVANLEDEQLPPEAIFAAALAEAEAGTERERAVVEEARGAVQLRQTAVDLVRSQRRPMLALSTAYGNVAYPSGFPAPGDFRTNWTVTIGGSLPILTGGRLAAEESSARADLDESRARLQLTRELAALDAEQARRDLAAARAAWEATRGTIQQAQRAYEIGELRFREGVGTQLELSDARLLLQQAQANRALAARDVQAARARLALLPGLPLNTGTGGIGGAPRVPPPAAPPPDGPLQSRGDGTAGSFGGPGVQR